jgi:hypothetical protein
MSRTLIVFLLAGCQDYDVHRMKDFDTYVQGQPNSPMDVLWLIDSSATMAEEQELVAMEMNAFVDILIQAQVDVQIGVITADISDDGALVGDVLSLDTPDLADTLIDQALVGISGDRYERHLESLAMATSQSMMSGSNAGMFRADASLQIIVLTDEDDQSSGNPEAYMDELIEWKGDQQMQFSAIAGSLPDGCHSLFAEAEAAPRLVDAVTHTNGQFESICEDDFGPVLSALALGATGMSNRFELSDFPALDSLVVWVDEARIHERPTDGWQYSPGDNSIVMDGMAIPRPGQKVKIEYYDLLGADAAMVEDSGTTQ